MEKKQQKPSDEQQLHHGSRPWKTWKRVTKDSNEALNMEEQAQEVGLYNTGSKMLVGMMLGAWEDVESKDGSKPHGLQSTCGCDTQAGGLQCKQ